MIPQNFDGRVESPAQNDRLVLTPSLRVAEDAPQDVPQAGPVDAETLIANIAQIAARTILPCGLSRQRPDQRLGRQGRSGRLARHRGDGKRAPRIAEQAAGHLVLARRQALERGGDGGLVVREKCSKDKRVVNVSLTDLGREKLSAAPEPLQAEFYRKFRGLEDWEQQMLRSALLRIAKMMDADELDVAPILQAGAIDEPSPWEN